MSGLASIALAASMSSSVSFGGRPPVRPTRRAAARPAWVRSRIRLRSNCWPVSIPRPRQNPGYETSTAWFPTHHRARIVAAFMAAIPVSIGLGAPVSTALLELDGVLGLAGWKWLFLGEAAPALIFGVICWFYLTDRPAHAKWLSPESKAWLLGEMEKEQKTVATGRRISVLQSLFSWRVLALGAIHFGQAGVSVGIAVFVAQIIKQLGLSNMETGFTTVIPYAAGTIGMIVWGHISDRMNERRWNLTLSCLTMGVGCALAGYCGASYWSILGLSLATVGLYASNAHLFPLPAVFLT